MFQAIGVVQADGKFELNEESYNYFYTGLDIDSAGTLWAIAHYVGSNPEFEIAHAETVLAAINIDDHSVTPTTVAVNSGKVGEAGDPPAEAKKPVVEKLSDTGDNRSLPLALGALGVMMIGAALLISGGSRRRANS